MALPSNHVHFKLASIVHLKLGSVEGWRVSKVAAAEDVTHGRGFDLRQGARLQWAWPVASILTWCLALAWVSLPAWASFRPLVALKALVTVEA